MVAVAAVVVVVMVVKVLLTVTPKSLISGRFFVAYTREPSGPRACTHCALVQVLAWSRCPCSST